MLTIGSSLTFVFTVSCTLAFVLAIGCTLTLMLAVGGSLAFVFTISSTLAFVLAVGSALALVLTVGGTCTFVLAVGGSLAFMLTIGCTLTLVCRSSGLRVATGSGILAAGRQFGAGSGVGLEIICIITQVAHLLADLVGSGLLGIIRHRQLGRGFVVCIILHTLEEGDILFETVHAFLAVFGSICLDGHRSAGLGGRSIDFGLGSRTQRKDGHKSHE